jgi:hypothetical protein
MGGGGSLGAGLYRLHFAGLRLMVVAPLTHGAPSQGSAVRGSG